MNLFETLGLISTAFGVGLAYGFSGGALVPFVGGAVFAVAIAALVFLRFRKAALAANLTEPARLKLLYWLMPISVTVIVIFAAWLGTEALKSVVA